MTTEKKPVLWLTFEKAENGIVSDKSGHAHNAVSVGHPVFSGDTEKGVCLSGDGSYFEIADAPELNFTREDSFTVSCRFRYDTESAKKGWQCIAQKGLLQRKGLYKYFGFWTDPYGRLDFGICNQAGSSCTNTPTQRLDTAWHEAVAVQDGEKQRLFFFMDGVMIKNMPSVDIASPGTPIFIGFSGEDGYFNGCISELKVYDSVVDTTGLVASRGVDDMEYHTFLFKQEETGEEVSLPYRIIFPTDYQSTNKTYPMLVYLHGYGEIGEENERQIRILGGQNALVDKVIARDDCIVLAPQCHDPAPFNWVPLNHVWNTGSRELTENPTVSLGAVYALLTQIIAGERIDKKRVYISGVSMGGYGTWELITRHPELFAAAVPLCGSGIPSLAGRLVDLPIWAMHGVKDPTVPAKGTEDMVKAITEAGGKKIKVSYYDADHAVWPYAYAEPTLVDWIFSQKKQ